MITTPLKVGYNQPASEMVFQSWADDGLTMNDGLVFQGIWTSIAKKQHFFMIFSGGVGQSPPPPPWIRAC